MSVPLKELILMTLDRLLKGRVTAKEVAEEFCRLIESSDKRPEVDYEGAFVRHIEGHLSGDQIVVCKICGKTILEIATEARLKEAADE